LTVYNKRHKRRREAGDGAARPPSDGAPFIHRAPPRHRKVGRAAPPQPTPSRTKPARKLHFSGIMSFSIECEICFSLSYLLLLLLLDAGVKISNYMTLLGCIHRQLFFHSSFVITIFDEKGRRILVFVCVVCVVLKNNLFESSRPKLFFSFFAILLVVVSIIVRACGESMQ
jgi:hypothetical protein